METKSPEQRTSESLAEIVKAANSRDEDKMMQIRRAIYRLQRIPGGVPNALYPFVNKFNSLGINRREEFLPTLLKAVQSFSAEKKTASTTAMSAG